MRPRAYLDNNATGRISPEVLAAMMPYLTDNYVNASSAAGELAGAGMPVQQAKAALAQLLGSHDAQRIFLTSGASESNSWAVHIATHGQANGRLVSTAIEHPSSLAALEAKRMEGWSVDLVRPQASGRINPTDFAQLLSRDTALVSVMLANNETGVIQPIEEIAALVRATVPAALFHVDATQAVGRIALSLEGNLGDADLISVSAHKFHGPKGCGALFVADGITPYPLIHGSQQNGLRGGTPDVASAAGLAAAARLAAERLPLMAKVQLLRDQFEVKLASQLRDVHILGANAPRLPNTSCFVYPGVDADHLVEMLAGEGIVIAAGAACTSGASAPSHVLRAMGVDHSDARSALRVSLSADTTVEELDLALERIVERVVALA